MRKNTYYSANDFRDWLSNQSGVNEFCDMNSRSSHVFEEVIGCEAHTKISFNKLMQKCESEDEDLDVMIEEFVLDGGKIVATEGRKFKIEVESGAFYVPRSFVQVMY